MDKRGCLSKEFSRARRCFSGKTHTRFGSERTSTLSRPGARTGIFLVAFSILGLEVPGVAIKGAGAVSKTFPGFYEMLAELAR